MGRHIPLKTIRGQRFTPGNGIARILHGRSTLPTWSAAADDALVFDQVEASLMVGREFCVGPDLPDLMGESCGLRTPRGAVARDEVCMAWHSFGSLANDFADRGEEARRLVERKHAHQRIMR